MDADAVNEFGLVRVQAAGKGREARTGNTCGPLGRHDHEQEQTDLLTHRHRHVHGVGNEE